MHFPKHSSLIHQHRGNYQQNLAHFEQRYKQAHECVFIVKICRGYAGLYSKKEHPTMIGEKVMDLKTARQVAKAFAEARGIPYSSGVFAFNKPVITVYYLHIERHNKKTQATETITMSLPVRLGPDTLRLVETDYLFQDLDGTEQTARAVASRLASLQKALFIPELGRLFNASLYAPQIAIQVSR